VTKKSTGQTALGVRSLQQFLGRFAVQLCFPLSSMINNADQQRELNSTAGMAVTSDRGSIHLRTNLNLKMVYLKIRAAMSILLAFSALTACDVELRKSDAELGLNPEQASGRKVYDNYCDRCHRAYSTKGKKGPGLKGIFQHPYLSLSGLPANDDRVGDIIRNGRTGMPGYGPTLSQQEIQDLLAYLHTL
jgi:mono/diheme cytochrome c family protein